MLINIRDSLLLIVDVQTKLLKFIKENEQICWNINRLISIFDKLRLPIIVTEQYPIGLGHTSEKISEPIFGYAKFEKTTFSCFSNKNIKNKLLKLNKKQIIICGIETHICVLQTAFELKEDGYNVFIMSDCVGSRKTVNHLLGIKRFGSRQIEVIDTEMLLFELLRDSNHKNFRELSKLIK